MNLHLAPNITANKAHRVYHSYTALLRAVLPGNRPMSRNLLKTVKGDSTFLSKIDNKTLSIRLFGARHSSCQCSSSMAANSSTQRNFFHECFQNTDMEKAPLHLALLEGKR